MPKQDLKLKIIFPLFAVCAFFALAGEAKAATYYVDATNGNDSWTGTAGAYQSGTAGPWKTIAKVNGFNFQPGDDVYFKCEETWNLNQEWTALTIDWSGSASNRVTIGAYYMNGNAPVVGVSGNRPKLSGNYRFPTNYYGTLVKNTPGSSYITFQDLHIYGSYSGYGFYAGECDNVSILRTKIEKTYDTGIVFFKATNSLIDSCEVVDFVRSALGVDEILHTDDDNKNREGVNMNWGGGTIFRRNCHNSVIRNSIVHEGWGEAIHVAEASHNCVVENNTVYNTRIGIFQWGGSDNLTIRNNNLYYTPDLKFYLHWDNGWKPGPAIYLDDEHFWNYYGSDHVYVYNNLVAGAHRGLIMGSSHPDSPISHWYIHNNTFVDCNVFIQTWNAIPADKGGGSNPIENCSVKNNIFYCPSGGCIAYRGVSNNAANFGFGYNVWPSNPGINAAGAGDVYASAVNMVKTSGWKNLVPGSFDSDNFKLLAGSAAINKGAALGSPYNLDYFGTARPQGAAWEIGAHEYSSGGDTQAPASPSGLSVR